MSAKKTQKARDAMDAFVDPVLGYKPALEPSSRTASSSANSTGSPWDISELKNILVTHSKLRQPEYEPQSHYYENEGGSVLRPVAYSQSIGPVEQDMLFSKLVGMSMDAAINKLSDSKGEQALNDSAAAVERKELEKATMLGKLVDLRSASSRGLRCFNTRRVLRVFGRQQGDSGSPEVQAAVMTMRIRSFVHHLSKNPKDNTALRSMRTLVHKRAKVLKYLRSQDTVRFDAIMPRLGLDKACIDGAATVAKVRDHVKITVGRQG